MVAGLSLAVAGTNAPLGPDGPVDRWLISLRGHLNGPASAIGSLSHPARFAVLLVLLLVGCALLRTGRAALALLISLAATEVAVEILKRAVDRHEAIFTQTFPSGHTAVATVIATVAVLACRPGGAAGVTVSPTAFRVVAWIAALLVVVVAASVIIIQDHYLTDTLAAVPLGLAVTLLVARALDALAISGLLSPLRKRPLG